jgi:hypothetical protein
VDRPLAREQALDEVAADEARRPGHEVVHDCLSSDGREIWPRSL